VTASPSRTDGRASPTLPYRALHSTNRVLPSYQKSPEFVSKEIATDTSAAAETEAAAATCTGADRQTNRMCVCERERDKDAERDDVLVVRLVFV